MMTIGAVKLAAKSKTIEAAWLRSADRTQKIWVELDPAAPVNRSSLAWPRVTSDVCAHDAAHTTHAHRTR